MGLPVTTTGGVAPAQPTSAAKNRSASADGVDCAAALTYRPQQQRAPLAVGGHHRRRETRRRTRRPHGPALTPVRASPCTSGLAAAGLCRGPARSELVQRIAVPSLGGRLDRALAGAHHLPQPKPRDALRRVPTLVVPAKPRLGDQRAPAADVIGQGRHGRFGQHQRVGEVHQLVRAERGRPKDDRCARSRSGRCGPAARDVCRAASRVRCRPPRPAARRRLRHAGDPRQNARAGCRSTATSARGGLASRKSG